MKMGPHVKNKMVEIEINPNLSEIIGEEIHYLEELEKKYNFTSVLKPNKEFHLWEYKFHILQDKH
jgi:ribonuclease G